MTTKTIVGRAGADAELRTTQSGKPVANFSVAETKRRFNRQTNDWEDAWTIWHDVEAYTNAEAIAAGVRSGVLLIVMGEERDGSYTNRDGVKIRKTVVTAQAVGPVLRDQTAQRAEQQSQDEPWSTPTSNNTGWAQQGSYGDNTPF